MEIRLSFMLQREVMNFTVKDRQIFYSDRFWTNAIRCIPKDELFMKKIIMSRNKYSPKLAQMFTLSEAQQKEYETAKDDEELALIIMKDCLKKGLVLIKKEVVKDDR